jgi:hypothetical protein
METGCEILNNLWKTALDCNIDKPGISGTIDRTIGFVQCKNIRDFMVIATLKCWHEKGNIDMPPIIITDEKIKYIEKEPAKNYDKTNK